MARRMGPHPRATGFEVYATADARDARVAALVAEGFRYVRTWRDARGYGVHGVQFAEWQTPQSAASVN